MHIYYLELLLFDGLGRMMSRRVLDNNLGRVSFKTNAGPGIYFIALIKNESIVLSKKVSVF